MDRVSPPNISILLMPKELTFIDTLWEQNRRNFKKEQYCKQLKSFGNYFNNFITYLENTQVNKPRGQIIFAHNVSYVALETL